MKINIYKSEFRDFVFNNLEGFYEEIELGGEYAYQLNIGNGYYLRLLSSVDIETEKSRDENDAIRIHIYNKNNDEVVQTPEISHRKRTPNYKNKIKKDIEELIFCPKCKNQLRVAKDKNDYKFCISDKCNYTESF